MSAIEDKVHYLKEAILPAGTEISILVNGNPVKIEGFDDLQFPVTVPTDKECVALIKFTIRDAPP